MRTINDRRVLNALIRDEREASKDYYLLSKNNNIPPRIQDSLLRMSREEESHAEILSEYKKWLDR